MGPEGRSALSGTLSAPTLSAPTPSAPEPLGAQHDVSRFDCGRPALNEWLQRRGLGNQDRDFTRVIVVHVDGRVVGYYGLAPTGVVPATMPRRLRTGQPPDPVPAFLLGQLATDVAWAGRGVSAGLLQDALLRCVAAAQLVAGRAVVVNAIDAAAAGFWRRHGFMPSRDDPLLLFRSIGEIAASVEGR